MVSGYSGEYGLLVGGGHQTVKVRLQVELTGAFVSADFTG